METKKIKIKKRSEVCCSCANISRSSLFWAGWGCGFMEGVVSRQFPLSEHLSVLHLFIHSLFHLLPTSGSFLNRVKALSSHYFLRQLQRHCPALLSMLRRGRTGGWGPSGIRCHMELSTSCDFRPCSQSYLASWKSYSDGGQRVI